MSETPLELPEAFAQRMKEKLGGHYDQFCHSLQTPSPISIRINPKKKYAHEGEQIPWCNTGRYLVKRPVFTLDPAFHAGAYYVQEASSMFLEQVFHQLGLTSKPIRILDLSAAPGGKSTHIISLLHPESLLVSNEVIRSRAMILNENMTKWGYDHVVVTQNDPSDFQQLPGFFDVIVVDAPCSGEGLFRKDSQAIKEWSVEQANHCALRQRRILADIWPALKTNGLLIYSTCTYNPAENEENLHWLGTQHSIESLPLKLENDWGIKTVEHKQLVGYQFFPHRVKGEGFFITVLRKNEIQEEIPIKYKKITSNLSQKISEQVRSWVNHPEEFSLNLQRETINLVRESLRERASWLQQHLNVLSAGTPVASVKGEKLIPEHALAVSINLNSDNFHQLALSLDDSLKYLRKENLALPEYKKGHALVTYSSLPLGWLNVLDNRANNLYPKDWRIRIRS
jgi:16S rRNA C967 or C1407 C5-methylase (RsmB/RsmF family)/NOL1/NOP2/fmu family ribosome biogenesis protein